MRMVNNFSTLEAKGCDVFDGCRGMHGLGHANVHGIRSDFNALLHQSLCSRHDDELPHQEH
eukprot:2747343-Amphidinium_carterae.1